jgi:hypothetical protein
MLVRSGCGFGKSLGAGHEKAHPANEDGLRRGTTSVGTIHDGAHSSRFFRHLHGWKTTIAVTGDTRSSLANLRPLG